MLIDVSKRDIRIPVKFLPYLEKYNIYALFHEVARQLAIAMPVDHISFMYRILNHAAAKCNVRQIIILAPPFLNMLNFANQLASETNVTVITETQIEEVFNPFSSKNESPEFEVAKRIKKLISLNHKDCKQGWLLIGYPETKKEAVALQRNGIIPTHVLNFVPAFMTGNDDDEPHEWLTYRKNLTELRKVFSKQWHDISMSGRDITELMKVCLNVTNFNERLRYVITPRILIIGRPGSGQKTIAKSLQEKLKIVHVHFPLILNRALRNNDSEYEEYQELKTSLNMDPSKVSRLHMGILMKVLLGQNCVDKGWIVTGFPNTLEDMKRLDKTDTPPNRIFFFDCSEEVCLKRLKKSAICEEDAGKTTVNVTQLNIDEISKYCGETASHIRTDQSCTNVLNTVLALIMHEAPISFEHRNPYEDYERLPNKKLEQQLVHSETKCLFAEPYMNYNSSRSSKTN